MFSYYGSKSKIVHLYPKPIHDKIIEPFAGSARYSLRHWEKDVLLVDKYKTIVDIWHYLQNASKKDILDLRNIKIENSLSESNIEKHSIEYKFLGFLTQAGQGQPRNKISPMRSPNYIKSCLKRIANDSYKIKHWKIIQGDYREMENEKATWFVDPPYQYGGHLYKESNKNIDFKSLSEWCKTRNGQVIVCENTKSDWMDFKPMIKFRGTMNTTIEAIWTNFPTKYNTINMGLFE